jgi:hypothetical protein
MNWDDYPSGRSQSTENLDWATILLIAYQAFSCTIFCLFRNQRGFFACCSWSTFTMAEGTHQQQPSTIRPMPENPSNTINFPLPKVDQVSVLENILGSQPNWTE